jgi:acyl transferase domain-containing protein/NADPH:quinone reductase-like Zn-dependent oxidoreductase/acyl carrier protein
MKAEGEDRNTPVVIKRREPIAIVGIGCRFPGNVVDPESLWRLLINGVDAVGDVPADRWDVRRFFHPDGSVPGKTYARQGGFLSQSPFDIDASFFGLSNREAAVLDPQQRLLLEVTWEALEDAGHDCVELRGRKVGVFVGGFSLDNFLDRFGASSRDYISPSTATSATLVMLSNRLSHAFDFVGPSISIDTACSSSLVATHLACASLWRGESEIAIAGGVNVMLAPEPFVAMAKGGFLSRSGRCKAFDASADGYVRAEGVSVVVLKPLAAATANGDRIYASILASGVNQDGHTRGISMPNPRSQQVLIKQVLADAGVSRRDIVYVEAHGPGTQAGDPVEANSLGTEIGAGRTHDDDALWVGSIKTSIGHTEAAAGAAGLIKAALVLYHRVVPPNLHFQTPNPKIDLPALGLRIPIKSEALASVGPLYAAVNSFGYGGTNAHSILSTPPQIARAEVADNNSLIRLYPLSARNEEALTAFSTAVADATGTMRIEDLGHSLAKRRAHHAVRAAVWARSSVELAENLNNLERARSEGRASIGRAPERARRLLFVYTGMGAQYTGMGRGLFAKERVFREAIECCDALLARIAGASLMQSFAGRLDDGSIGKPVGTPRDAQLPNLAMQVGLTKLWRSLGIEPEGTLGHSVGEIGAAWAAGVLTLEEALRLTYHRAEAFQRLVGKGSMMAVGLSLEAISKLLHGRADDVTITAILAPDSVVVGGPPAALDKLASDLSHVGVFNRKLHVDVAYHHQQVDLIEDDLRTRFGSVVHQAGQLPLYSTLYGRRLDTACHNADYWCRGSRDPADFMAAITAAMEDGFNAVLEVGPNRVLSAAVKSCASVSGQSVWTGASMVRGEREEVQVRRTLADMYVQGVPVNWDLQHPNGHFERYPRYPWQRERLWVEAPETRRARVLDPKETWLHQRVEGPGAAWSTDLSSSIFAYLADHVIAGTSIFPAAGHVAALLAGSRALNRGNCLEWLRLERVLPLSHGTVIRIDIEEGTGAAAVYARTDRNSPWHRHASARLGLPRPPRRPRVDIDRVRLTGTQHIAADDLYVALARNGLTYGPAFRAIREIWFGPDELVAAISLPEGLAQEGPVHPILIDGAFQALAVVASQSEGQGSFVPVAVREIRLHGALESAAWAAAHVIQRTTNSFSASLSLCDTDGTVIVEIDELRCQALPMATFNRPNAYFEDTWERSTVPPLKRSSVQHWLLVADEDDLVNQLSNEFRHYGHRTRLIKHALADLAVGRLNVDGVVWLTPRVDREDAGLDASNKLLKVIQLIVSEGHPAPRLVIVTHGATGKTPRPDHAAVWGLGRVAAAEHHELRVTLVDCHDGERVPLWLAREVLGDTLDREVRLESEGRLVCRVRPWSAPDPEAQTVNVAEVPVTLHQTRAGTANSLTWHETHRRAPGPGEIEIRSIAAALNFKDILKSMNLLSGAYLENTFFGDNLGMETAGVVTRIGDGVTGFLPGDEVVILSPNFTSYLVVDARLVRKKPAGLSFTQAPVFINYGTAHHGLVDIGRLQSRERVLIHLGSGGVGQAAISVARMIGAEIFSTAGDPEKRAYLKNQGIEHVFDSRSLDFADGIMEITCGVGVDVVLNSLAGEGLRRSWDILAPYGRFVEIGKRDIEDNAALSMRRFDENRTFSAIDIDRILRERPALLQRIFSDVERLFAEGRIGPLPTTAFPANQVSEAFRVMSRARHIGKVVINFEGQSVPARRLPPPLFRNDRTYLVTGAFGGFGMALVRWMAQEGAQHLVLVGRNGASTGETRSLVTELRRQGGAVSIRALDVADEACVDALLVQIRADGPPLGGIFHAAVVLDDALLSVLDSTRLEAVMRAKALGAWYLHRASQADPLEHFVLFSSVAQVIGNVGQGAYCAANAFLDGLARRRRAEGLPGLSVAWGVLSDVGIAARSRGLLAQLEKLGIRAFTSSQALVALGRLMRQAPPCVAFADVDWELWAGHAELAATPRFKNIVQSSAGGDRLALFRRELLAHPAVERPGTLQAKLAAALSLVLGLPAARIPFDRALDKVGVDSLMAVELSLNFERDSGVRLPTSLLMQGPTITDIAAHVLKDVLAVENLDEAAVDSLSEVETDALLAMFVQTGELDLASVS